MSLKSIVKKLSAWAWSDERAVIDGMARIEELHATSGAMELEIKRRPELAQYMALCFAELLSSAENYAELTFETREKTGDRIIVTVQKNTGLTPHQLRLQAERERDQALRQLQTIEKENRQ